MEAKQGRKEGGQQQRGVRVRLRYNNKFRGWFKGLDQIDTRLLRLEDRISTFGRKVLNCTKNRVLRFTLFHQDTVPAFEEQKPFMPQHSFYFDISV